MATPVQPTPAPIPWLIPCFARFQTWPSSRFDILLTPQGAFPYLVMELVPPGESITAWAAHRLATARMQYG